MEQHTVRPWSLIIAIVLVGILIFCISYSMNPPEPKGSEIGDDQFSAQRTIDILKELIPENKPHPAGTQENKRVRERIKNKFTSFGYKVTTHDTVYFKKPESTFYELQNIMTRLPGTTDSPAVAIVAHHDSVGAGPGANDDMSSVALILEVARMAKIHGPYKNPIIFLITDGEEHWLLGARAFVNEHPWAKDIGPVINLEARGTAGRSTMFETIDNNGWLVSALAETMQHPEANSLAYEVYKRMPNDTDFTVFKQAGHPGLNYAYIENSQFYHTSYDDLEHLTPGSIQHQGENVWSIVQHLANHDLSSPPPGNHVFFTLFGKWFFHWPESWTMIICLSLFALFVIALIVFYSTKTLTPGSLGWGILSWLITLFVSSSAGILILTLLGRYDAPWIAYPLPTRITLWCSIFILVWICSLILKKRTAFWDVLIGSWCWWIIISVVVGYYIPGAVFIFLIPSCTAALLLLLGAITPLKRYFWFRESITIVIILATGLFWIGLSISMEIAMGFYNAPAVVIPLALFLTMFMPMFHVEKISKRNHIVLILIILLVGIASFTSALIVPKNSEHAPQRLNILYVEDAGLQEAKWCLQGGFPIPSELETLASFSNQWEEFFGGYGRIAETSPIGLAPSSVTMVTQTVEENKRTVQLNIKTAEWADGVQLVIPATVMVKHIQVNERTFVPHYYQGHRMMTYRGIPEEGLKLTLTIVNQEPVSIALFSEGYGLPEEGNKLIQARLPYAVPTQWGDKTRLIQRIRF